MDRVILHSDLNNYFASVECLLHPELRGKAIAVCGSEDNRHGIVLAKSELAKAAGVKTAEPIWQAKQKCQNLIIVEPTRGEYVKFSRRAREIYYSFTDMVEPFGIDEAWLDVTGSRQLFGDGKEIADKIRTRMKSELGLTVSVGISFNKVFAKLGSDMKKPDAVTEITRENFREKVWRLDAGDLLYVGGATKKRLNECGIYTIGDIAKCDKNALIAILGKMGEQLYIYANGLDESPVQTFGVKSIAKSIGHGTTLASDLKTTDEVLRVILDVSQSVARRLRESSMKACTVQISIRDESLVWKQFQTQVPYPTHSFKEISAVAGELFREKYDWKKNVRAVCVTAIKLIESDAPYQTDMFCDQKKRDKQDKLECAVESIRARFGKNAVDIASLMERKPLDDKNEDSK